MPGLDALLAELPSCSLNQLRQAWRERFGAPPALRSRDLLCRALAEWLQLEALGSDPVLDQRIRAELARLRPGRKPTINRPRYRPGAVLEKEWQGGRHHVEVLPDGYRWNGQIYTSTFLSPHLKRQILDGRQPAGLTLQRLMTNDIPLAWDQQMALCRE